MHHFTAMVLDDHYLVRQGFATVAQNIPGLSIIGTYEHSRELIAAMTLRQPRILFADFILRSDDMDGLTLIRFIKRRFCDVKIIVISAHTKIGIVSLALRAGADGFCSKGTSTSELAAATSRVLAGQIYVPEHTETRSLEKLRTQSPILDNGDLPALPNALKSLSPREREIITLFLMGMSITDISKKLSRDRKTISGHKQSAYRKLGISGDAELFSLKHILE
ncbi:response regulator transcription factor [Burkholderia orbicola]|uniref:response regulator transcription factor n=1 Tax=Burkholderia orbicola TaxID=2978683 RepID=UPI002FE20D77